MAIAGSKAVLRGEFERGLGARRGLGGGGCARLSRRQPFYRWTTGGGGGGGGGGEEREAGGQAASRGGGRGGGGGGRGSDAREDRRGTSACRRVRERSGCDRGVHVGQRVGELLSARSYSG